ncbi:MAG: cysteine--tRNA ligase [Patescibacteria group bacterium]
MKLYNTLSRKVEEFQPIKPPKVGFYACGLTVYDYTHLGHLRKYTMDDVLIRTLKHAGYLVKFVQNLTDVGHLASDADEGEDKLEKGARKYHQTVWDIAKKFEDYFFYSMDLMGNLRPDVSCRATDHIEEQIALVKKLDDKGFTYQIPGDGIYFDTSKLDDYGHLARLKPEKLRAGQRVAMVEGKRNPTDFALWKFERPGENRAMVWPSPWAERSFPGWHVECSAMSMKYLGEQFDVHTGGIDHIPVHHSDEIAQSEAATGKKPFVKYWVHHNFLRVDGEKMSKSLGNFFTIDDLLDRGYSPRALRMLFLSTHYRSKLNFTWKTLDGMQKNYQRLCRMAQDIQQQVETIPKKATQLELTSEQRTISNKFRSVFFGFLEDDLKTPEALVVFFEVLRFADLTTLAKLQLLLEFEQIFQLDIFNPNNLLVKQYLGLEELPVEIVGILDERRIAREQKNWYLSDKLRQDLQERGYEVIDESSGQRLRKI